MKLNYNKNQDGLVPAIIQDNRTLKVLMLGYLNKESLSLTLSTNVVHFYSRTKKEYGKKVRKVVTNYMLFPLKKIVI